MLDKTNYRKAIASAKSFDGEQIYSLIQLFKIAPVMRDQNELVMPAEKGLQNGIIFVSSDGDIMEKIPVNVFNAAINLYGNNKDLFNKTFYNSFAKVRDANPLELVFDQIAHYFSTYGAEAMGISIPTYVPAQALTEVPEAIFTNKNFKFLVIQFKTAEDCIERLNKYLATLTAPSQAILASIKKLLPLVTIDTDDIKSFEIQVMQHTRLGTVPKHPVNQLRYLVYRTTDQTLLIKNKALRTLIKDAALRTDREKASRILLSCDPIGLASIFLRFKPIFLAYKSHKGCAPIINKLRRLAKDYHQPMNAASLQNLTSVTDPTVQAQIISKATTRELIKVLNSVRSRLAVEDATPGVFSIRNGRTFVKENGIVPNPYLGRLGNLLQQAIVSRLRDTLSGKTFYMPEYIDYAVPTTEKQFVGNIPYGTRINGVPGGAFTIGVHWFNQKGKNNYNPDGRVDIDLHLNSATNHYGWNGTYTDGSDIIYTGDLTDAPKPLGAAEAYWFSPQDGVQYIVTANLFSGPSETEYKMFMTEVKPKVNNYDRRQRSPYTYNPNESLFPAIPLKFNGDEKSQTIGMFADGGFYFYGGTLANGIVPSANYQQFLEGLTAQLDTKVLLRDLIEACDGSIITDTDHLTTEELADVVSLAPEDITVETLLNIVDGIAE
jgi:hypothetical protein